MKNNYLEIVNQINNEQDSILVTIIKQTGSSPRGVGSEMVVTSSGLVSGTIGGGAVENEAIKLSQKLLTKGASLVKKYLLKANQVEDLGMVCGGEIDVLFYFINHQDNSQRELFNKCVENYKKQESSWLMYTLNQPQITCTFCEHTDEESLQNHLKKNCHSWTENNIQMVSLPINLSNNVYIFGGGHVAQALVPVLASLDFCPTIFEDRLDFLKPELFPSASGLIYGSFDKIKEKIKLTENDYGIVMTRGHKSDLILEVQLLRTDAFYLGVIGSKHKVALHRKELLQQGFSENEINRLHTPIGLPIKAETPAEIAISIAAELIACRANKKG